MRERVANLTTKKLSEFHKTDTFYVSKNEGGFNKVYFAQFERYARGIVTGVVLQAEEVAKLKKGDIVTARASKTYLWGKLPGEEFEHCHWYVKGLDGYIEPVITEVITVDFLLEKLLELYRKGYESFWGEPAQIALVAAQQLGLYDELLAKVDELEDVKEFTIEVSSSYQVKVLAPNLESAYCLVRGTERADQFHDNRFGGDRGSKGEMRQVGRATKRKRKELKK